MWGMCSRKTPSREIQQRKVSGSFRTFRYDPQWPYGSFYASIDQKRKVCSHFCWWFLTFYLDLLSQEKNPRCFNTSKISKPWLRHSPERRSKSSELITEESMWIMRSIIFAMRQGFSCSTQFPILRSKTKLLSGKNRSLKEMASCMQSHCHKDYGPKNLTVKNTSKIDIPIDMSRIRPPMRLRVASH